MTKEHALIALVIAFIVSFRLHSNYWVAGKKRVAYRWLGVLGVIALLLFITVSVEVKS